MKMAPTDRIRGQARFYSGFGSSPNFAFDTTSVGAGLLANAVDQATVMAPTDRGVSSDGVEDRGGSGNGYGADRSRSRASALLQRVGVITQFRTRYHICSSRLAGERGGSGNGCGADRSRLSGDGDAADRSRSRASALLQRVWVITQFRVRYHIRRSRLAGERGGPGNDAGAGRTRWTAQWRCRRQIAFAGKRAPTVGWVTAPTRSNPRPIF
jgi:hypothetical protein